MASASETYWNNFNVNDTDIERVYGFVLERGEATTLPELARVVISARAAEEQERRARLSSKAVLYQPKLLPEIGQRVIFSALNDAEGTVTAVRPSDNPRLPPFQVISVRFDTNGDTREFAAVYDLPHPLNEARPLAIGASDESPEEIYARYGERIEFALETRLRNEKDFVEQGGKWLLRGLLANVHVGLLNIAEAAIEQNNAAMTPDELARVLELDIEGNKREANLFSLDYALRHDERFTDVGPQSETRWFLARLVPGEARVLPRVLQSGSAPRSFEPLTQELETILSELEDEGDDSERTEQRTVGLILTYPHRRAGSLPITPGVRALLPDADKPTLITVVDENTNARVPGWIMPQANCIVGLKAWYDQLKLNPGAVLEVEPRGDPLSIGVRYHPQRERGLWVRSAKVQGGHLTFGTDRRPVAHKYDEDMLILIGDPSALDNLTASNYGDRPLDLLLADVFPELAKLVPGGRVHAKTLYSAVNFAKRYGPRAVLTALAQGELFSSVGGGYFTLQLVPRPA